MCQGPLIGSRGTSGAAKGNFQSVKANSLVVPSFVKDYVIQGCVFQGLQKTKQAREFNLPVNCLFQAELFQNISGRWLDDHPVSHIYFGPIT